ncbi:MAG: hypothetical protein WCT24_02365 [Patescibacteria group bacterium]|jgi:hypothetical protein
MDWNEQETHRKKIRNNLRTALECHHPKTELDLVEIERRRAIITEDVMRRLQGEEFEGPWIGLNPHISQISIEHKELGPIIAEIPRG